MTERRVSIADMIVFVNSEHTRLQAWESQSDIFDGTRSELQRKVRIAEKLMETLYLLDVHKDAFAEVVRKIRKGMTAKSAT